MSVEIYIDDLKPDIQRQVLEELGLETAEDGNYDIIPSIIWIIPAVHSS